jgi:hypothetical protein
VRRRKDGGVRLWPVVLILVLAAGFQVWNWSVQDPGHRQMQVMLTLLTGQFAGLALLLWFLFFSRLGLLARLAGLAHVGVGLFAFHSRYEIRGF